MRKELIIHTNKELCLLPSGSRTSSVKASNMLSLTPQGDDHGAWHWYWARGLMPPVELPVPVCSADAWADSMAVQPCHAWPPRVSETLNESKHNRDRGPCGTEMPSLWQLTVASKRAAQPAVSTQGKQKWVQAGGILRHDLNELSLLSKCKFKQQVDVHIYWQSAQLVTAWVWLLHLCMRSRRWAQTTIPWR